MKSLAEPSTLVILAMPTPTAAKGTIDILGNIVVNAISFAVRLLIAGLITLLIILPGSPDIILAPIVVVDLVITSAAFSIPSKTVSFTLVANSPNDLPTDSEVSVIHLESSLPVSLMESNTDPTFSVIASLKDDPRSERVSKKPSLYLPVSFKKSLKDLPALPACCLNFSYSLSDASISLVVSSPTPRKGATYSIAKGSTSSASKRPNVQRSTTAFTIPASIL